jgi:hypothetical protein
MYATEGYKLAYSFAMPTHPSTCNSSKSLIGLLWNLILGNSQKHIAVFHVWFKSEIVINTSCLCLCVFLCIYCMSQNIYWRKHCFKKLKIRHILCQISFYVSNLVMGCPCPFWSRRCTNPRLQVTVAKFSVWNFLHFTLQVPRILRWLLDP